MTPNNDLSGLISSVLNDDKANEKIGEIVNMLMSGAPAEAPDFSQRRDNGNVSGIINAIENMNPQTDAGLNLLSALSPYLRPSRAKRMNTVVRLMQISKIAPLFGSDIFSPKNDSGGAGE